MTNAKSLGIWMDHANAHLIEFTTDPMETTMIESKFTHQAKEESLSKSESLMHHKEQHQQGAFYKNLGEIIRNYESVILFGPTDAKKELFNLLEADHNFADIKIFVQQADKMTPVEEHNFVRAYFSKK
ncbi:MAG: hypothetical protein WCR52_15010 [Bacteroidota bacterium]|uniref:hypothetical protein n=1 Tax=Runella sp. TaxID=1960881 RepID=UPI00301967F2